MMIISTISAIGASAVSFFLFDKQKRGTIYQKLVDVKDGLSKKDYHHRMPIKEAGKPEESDNPENTKMVAEGSQFGVEYYQKLKHN